MRISDWSSDVCSSDLKKRRFKIKTTVMSLFRRKPRGKSLRQTPVSTADLASGLFQGSHPAPVPLRPQAPRHRRRPAGSTPTRPPLPLFRLDRKSDVSGKSGSVRVPLGGRGTFKKKKQNDTQ